MEIFRFFIANVILIALSVAFFEIITEKDKGWGAGHPKDKWYGKILWQNSPIAQTVVKALGVPYIFGYGFAMYGVIIPLTLIAEYLFLNQNVFLLLAIFVTVCFVEDFLWFVFNWYFDSLKQLFKGPYGSIWWHKKWVKIFKDTYLPQSYFSGLSLTLVFLLLAYYFQG